MFRLKNTMEDVVNKNIDSILNVMNICKCEKCRMDIMAISLNDLPAKYVVTETGELYTKVRELEQQFEVNVETAIIKAAIFVTKNPQH
ncbi:MAG TPA: late competence development ComFB family protein [Methanosarcinales archaeon]|nr:late competence development ComFB family protein [Methanosarcinales archaeon]